MAENNINLLQDSKIHLEDCGDDSVVKLLTMSGQVFAYGGESGDVYRIRADKGEKTVVRTFDDSLRFIAFSSNEKYVIVGFEEGEADLYYYPNHDKEDATRTKTIHPFVQAPNEASPNSDSNGLLSQTDTLDGPREGEEKRSTFVATTPIRSVLFLDNQYAVIASEDTSCVWDVTNESMVDTFLQEEMVKEQGGVGCRALAKISNTQRAFCTLDMDGYMAYWDCTADDRNEWKMIRKETSKAVTEKDAGELNVGELYHRVCRPTFDHGVLALPGASFWQLRKPSDSSQSDFAIEEKLHEAVSQSHSNLILVAFALPFGKYWVTLGKDKKVIVWEDIGKTDGPEMKMIKCIAEDLGSLPTDISFHDETLIISTNDSKIFALNNMRNELGLKTIEETSVTESAANNAADDQGEDLKNSSSPKRKRLEKQLPQDGFDDDDDDDDDIFSEPTKTSTTKFVDEEAADDDNADAISTGQSPSTDAIDRNPPSNDMDLDNDSLGSDSDDGELPVARAPPTYTLKLPEPQPAFAPSATPLDLSKRFLCWNHIGTVTSTQADSEGNRSTINITFHDVNASSRPTINFTDNMGFIVGALGQEGAIFASDLADDEEEDAELGEVVDGLQISESTRTALKRSRAGKNGKAKGSTIYFHRFETFANHRDKDWRLTLPTGERALGCTSGDGWNAVVTNRRFLRMFSTAGNQEQILWLSGDPVSIVGRSRFVAVFYHDSTPLVDGTQKLGCMVYDALANQIVSRGPVSCISKGSSLTWIGFSAESNLMAMDSDGMLSMLIKPQEDSLWEWMPVLDAQDVCKSTEDSLWPISCARGHLNCVPLKGGVKYPSAIRRPVTSKVGLRLPLALSFVPSTHVYEELVARSSVALTQQRVFMDLEGENSEESEREYQIFCANVDKATLKMFHKTLESNKLEKAFDLVSRLHLEKSFDLALKMANQHDKLWDKIEALKETRFSEGDDEESDDYEETEMPNYEERPHVSPDTATGTKRMIEREGLSRSVRRREGFA